MNLGYCKALRSPRSLFMDSNGARLCKVTEILCLHQVFALFLHVPAEDLTIHACHCSNVWVKLSLRQAFFKSVFFAFPHKM